MAALFSQVTEIFAIETHQRFGAVFAPRKAGL